MRQMIGAVVVGLMAVTAAQAHFPFVVASADGASARVVFSDDFNPDSKVNIEKIANTKLTLRDGTGKDTALVLNKGDGSYDTKLPGSGPRTVYGVTDYGVLEKGDAKPFRLLYYPKALVGTATARAVGGPLKVEIMPVLEAGMVKFQVLASGKPVADAEATVLVPGGGKKAVKTDKSGFTPGFTGGGRFGVFARHTVTGAGEHAGRKFEETRHYATLVVDIGK